MLQDFRLRSSFFAIGLVVASAACGDDSSSPSSGTSASSGGTGAGGGASASTGDATTGSTSSTTSGAGGEGGAEPATTTTTTGTGGATTTTGTGGSGAGGAATTGTGGAATTGTGGGGPGSGGAGGGLPAECLVPEDCLDPGTFCVLRTCEGGVCGTTPAADGLALPLADQTDGDCNQLVCDGAGGTRLEPDDADAIQVGDVCTIEICIAGVPDTEPASVGLDCGNGLTCDGSGSCVGCLVASDCPDPGECGTKNCTLSGECLPDPVAAGTPTIQQSPNDCQQLQCDGLGGIESVADDADVPADLVDCVVEGCSAGVPGTSNIGPGAACDDGGGALCNGAGSCVECLTAAQCPASTACVTYSCSPGGTCIPTFAPPGTPAGNPQAGDCRRDECDDAGNIVPNVPFNADVPVDPSDCTNNVCTNGNPTNPPLPINTACSTNGGIRCNASGTCVECNTGGQCGSGVCSGGLCVAPGCNDGVSNGNETGVDCGGPDCAGCPNGQACGDGGDCTSGFCNPNTSLCAAVTCNDGFLNGAETDVDCGGGTCTDCGLGYACGGDADCLSNYCFDGYCSESFCGDGGVNPGEACDDGDSVDFNGCDNDCRFTCGNSLLNNTAPTSPVEQCDDGGRTNGNGCNSTCQIEANYQCNLASPNVCVRQEVRCNNGANDDGDGSVADSADADCAWYYDTTPSSNQIPACAAGQTLYIFNSIRVPATIFDASTITNEIFVPNIGTVRRVMVRLNITHTFDADLDIFLRGGDGATSVELTTDNGGSSNNYTDTRFRQGASTNVTAGSAPFNGEYRPEGNLDNLNGTAAQGLWRLTVTDDGTDDVGTLNAFELAICAN